MIDYNNIIRAYGFRYIYIFFRPFYLIFHPFLPEKYPLRPLKTVE